MDANQSRNLGCFGLAPVSIRVHSRLFAVDLEQLQSGRRFVLVLKTETRFGAAHRPRNAAALQCKSAVKTIWPFASRKRNSANSFYGGQVGRMGIRSKLLLNAFFGLLDLLDEL